MRKMSKEIPCFERERPRPSTYDTETYCHCGAEYKGSDHCHECQCEQYESLHCDLQ